MFGAPTGDNDFGTGIRVGVSLEYVGFADGPFGSTGSQGTVVGHGDGQAAIGFELGATYRALSDQRSWILADSLVFRLPASYGVLFAVP